MNPIFIQKSTWSDIIGGVEIMRWRRISWISDKLSLHLLQSKELPLVRYFHSSVSHSLCLSDSESPMALCAPTHNLSLSSVKSHTRRTRRIPRSRRGYGTGMVAMAASYEYEEGQLERPKWAGQTPLSHLVRTIISFKPLYSLLKLGARNVLIRSLCLSHTHTHSETHTLIFLGFGSDFGMWVKQDSWEEEHSMEGNDKGDSRIRCI